MPRVIVDEHNDTAETRGGLRVINERFQERKVQVTGEGLRALAALAKAAGTERHWMAVALEWIEHADAEIMGRSNVEMPRVIVEELNASVKALLEILKWEESRIGAVSRDSLVAVIQRLRKFAEEYHE